MGGFPSHDAGAFLYTTSVQLPGSTINGAVEEAAIEAVRKAHAQGPTTASSEKSNTSASAPDGAAAGAATAATSADGSTKLQPAAAVADASEIVENLLRQFSTSGGQQSTPQGNSGSMEIALLPLMRRYFNDNNKRLKDAIIHNYLKGPAGATTHNALFAMQQKNTLTLQNLDHLQQQQQQQQQQTGPGGRGGAKNAGAASASATSMPGNAASTSAVPATGDAAGGTERERQRRAEKERYERDRAIHYHKALEHLLGEVESSYFQTTRSIFDCKEVAARKANRMIRHRADKMKAEEEEQQQRQRRVAHGADGGSPRDDGGEQEDKDASAAVATELGDHLDDRNEPSTDADKDDKKDVATEKAKREWMEQALKQLNNGAPGHGARGGSANITHPLMRPVPCAICVVEPEASGRTKAQDPANARHQYIQPGVGDWVVVQGRKLHCIGYLSLFSNQTVDLAQRSLFIPIPKRTPASAAKPASSGGAGHETKSGADTAADPVAPIPIEAENEESTSAPGMPTVHVGAVPNHAPYNVPKLETLKEDRGYDVYLELQLEDPEKYGFVLEYVVFLAAMNFRAQFMTCAMSARVLNSLDVEKLYHDFLELLNVHVCIGSTNYRALRTFYELAPLMEHIEEMGLMNPSIGPYPVANHLAAAKATVSPTANANVSGSVTSGPVAATAGSVPDGQPLAKASSSQATAAAAGDAVQDDAAPATSCEEKEALERAEGDTLLTHTDGPKANVEEEGEEADTLDDGVADAAPPASLPVPALDEGELSTRSGCTQAKDGDDEGEWSRRENSLLLERSVLSSSRKSRSSRKRLKKLRVQTEMDEIYRKQAVRMPRFFIYELERVRRAAANKPGLALPPSSGTPVGKRAEPLHSAGSGMDEADGSSSTVSFYPNGDAIPHEYETVVETGVEAVLDGALLARFMKFVTDSAAFETVKGSFVRCDLGPLLKEKRYLYHYFRENQVDAMEKDDEDDKRFYGSPIVASSVREWLRVGADAERRRLVKLFEETVEREETIEKERQRVLRLAEANNAKRHMMQLQYQQQQLLQQQQQQLAQQQQQQAAAAILAYQQQQQAAQQQQQQQQQHQHPSAVPQQMVTMYIPGIGYVQTLAPVAQAAAPQQPTTATSAAGLPQYYQQQQQQLQGAAGQQQSYMTMATPQGMQSLAHMMPQQQQQQQMQMQAQYYYVPGTNEMRLVYTPVIPQQQSPMMFMSSAAQQQQQQQQQTAPSSLPSTPMQQPQAPQAAAVSAPQGYTYQYMMNAHGQLVPVPVAIPPHQQHLLSQQQQQQHQLQLQQLQQQQQQLLLQQHQQQQAQSASQLATPTPPYSSTGALAGAGPATAAGTPSLPSLSHAATPPAAPVIPPVEHAAAATTSSNNVLAQLQRVLPNAAVRTSSTAPPGYSAAPGLPTAQTNITITPPSHAFSQHQPQQQQQQQQQQSSASAQSRPMPSSGFTFSYGDSDDDESTEMALAAATAAMNAIGMTKSKKKHTQSQQQQQQQQPAITEEDDESDGGWGSSTSESSDDASTRNQFLF